ncbi:hypothetical protein Ciccas_013639, partial [Cichlidogyrus casuarinus]
HNRRDNATIDFAISLPGMFAVPKYSDSLINIANSRGITRHQQSHLTRVDHKRSLVTIEKLDDKSTKQLKYDLLHIVPPMTAPEVIASNKDLTTPETGPYVAVDKATLQSVKWKNIFSLGDCSSLPTSKTAAAIASESEVLVNNLLKTMQGENNLDSYDGYTSCPLITGYNKGIIAEFLYDGKVKETLPMDQSQERRLHSFIKKSVLPHLYWNGMLAGRWPGPKHLRKLINPFS